jgi:hypothetical protein
MKDTFIVYPLSIKESKERNAFIKEFVGDTSVISFKNNDYLLDEIYLTYKIDSKKVHKQAITLVFKTIDIKTQKFDCPDDYSKFEIIIDTKKYGLGRNSFNLSCRNIPIDTKNFKLIYYDNNIKKVINFKEKVED